METILILLSIQGFIGAYDSIYHHEFKERLSLKVSARNELKIHSIRSSLYSIIFLSFGWLQWQGWLAVAFAAILVVELLLTLWDFVEEDRSRDLPATERVTHTILGLNFGAILALLAPELIHWFNSDSGLTFVDHGIYSWIMTLYGIGVIPFAIREYTSYRSLKVPTSVETRKPLPSIEAQNILITGATGFIGTQLCKALLSQGHELTLLIRDSRKAASLLEQGHRLTLIHSLDQLKSSDVFHSIINLAGEPIADGRWSARKKQRILDSRLNTTRQIINHIRSARVKPKVLISGSAIGYYVPRDDALITELSPGTPSFSHQLCVQWEEAANQARQFGVRVCLLRTGIVLGKTGGALAAMLIPYSYGLGGKLGNGNQWMSWIHITDMIGIILQTLANPDIEGPINATAPQPVQNKMFSQTLGSILHRPAVMSVPAFVLRGLLGEVADEIFLTSQKVIPKKITDHSYRFQYPDLAAALADILHS